MNEALVIEMVNRFLGWKLPQDFQPDCYISFDRVAAESLRDKTEGTAWPVGTNLFTADQAKTMVEYMLDGKKAPEAVPLSNDQIAVLAKRHADCFSGDHTQLAMTYGWDSLFKLAHAIEAAHGITPATTGEEK